LIIAQEEQVEMIVRIFALMLSLLFSFVASGQSTQTTNEREAARRQLAQKGIQFDKDAFLKVVGDGDSATVNQFLAAGMSPSVKDAEDIPALFRALRNGKVEIALALIRAGADVNVRAEEDENTALMIAAACGRASVVEALLAKGAELEAKDKGGHTPLLIALFGYGFRSTSAEYNAFVEQLIPNFKEDAGDCMDTSDGHARTVQLLLDKKADVNVRATDGGETPLFVALMFTDIKLVRALLDSGVNVNAPTWANRTALQWAQLLDSDAMRKDPEFKKNRTMVEWVKATAKGRAEIVRLLKKAGAR
jgi:hypothetical protein